LIPVKKLISIKVQSNCVNVLSTVPIKSLYSDKEN